MATSCCLCEVCEQHSKNAPERSDMFSEGEDNWKKWLNAIGEANDDARLSLCSSHFSQACSTGLILIDNATNVSPILEMTPTFSKSIAKTAETDRSSPQREPETKRSPTSLLHSLPSIRRPTITRGRRIHMLSKEEMKEVQPIKYVRYLKNVNWDEISKVPEEAKIVWEVAVEELKENNDKIKDLQAYVRQLGVTIQKLKKTLKRNKCKEV